MSVRQYSGTLNPPPTVIGLMHTIVVQHQLARSEGGGEHEWACTCGTYIGSRTAHAEHLLTYLPTALAPLDELLDTWDALTRGESATTAAIRERRGR